MNLMTLAGKDTYNLNIKTYEEDTGFLDAIHAGALDFFPIFTSAYLDMEDRGLVEPAAVVSQDGDDPRVSLVLLTAAEVQPGDLSALKGKTLMLCSAVSHGLERTWLEVILGEAGLPAPEAVFSECRTTAKANETLLAAFFGKCDFCVLTRQDWELLSELNPQLETKLHLVAESEPLLPNVMAFHRDCTGIEREGLLREMITLHERVVGRQVLTLTKVKRILPFDPGYLEATVRLRERHLALRETSVKDPAAVAENSSSQ